MRGLWSMAFLGCVLAIPPSLGSAKAQTQTPTTGTTRPRPPASTTMPPLDGRDTETVPDPQATLMEARRVRTLAADRQKKISEDAARLAQLAGEVKAGVDQAVKNETSADVIHKTEEIEKLAHDVKQRMKG
jgi:hypothetical protein